jgi:urease gamma subunit
LQDVLNNRMECVLNVPTDSTAGMEHAELSMTYARVGTTMEDVLNATEDMICQDQTVFLQRLFYLFNPNQDKDQLQLQDVLNNRMECVLNVPTDSTAGMEHAELSMTYARVGTTMEDVLNATEDMICQDQTVFLQRLFYLFNPNQDKDQLQLQDVLNNRMECVLNVPTDSTAGMEHAELSMTYARVGTTMEDVLNATEDMICQDQTVFLQRLFYLFNPNLSHMYYPQYHIQLHNLKLPLLIPLLQVPHILLTLLNL